MTAHVDDPRWRAWLTERFVDIGCDRADITPHIAFSDLGIGSRDSVALAGELSELVGRQISPVDFWEHPTIDELVAFLCDPNVASSATSERPAAGRAQSMPVGIAEDDAVAVIGLGCRFPGGITDPDSYWQFLLDERCGVTTVPSGRWDAFADGTAATARALSRTTRWGGFLDDISAFDAEFFDISPSEADKMDPQQRLLLEVSHEALEHAGIPSEALRHTQTGVFVGSCAGEYGSLIAADLDEVDNWTGTGGAQSIIANRLSYHYDLRGPSLTIDTACSSSLVAIHLAATSIRSGESTMAIAAGVNLMLSPAVTRSFDRNDAMSASGRCHSFDAAADGYVRAEGCGAVILKSLADAQRDGNDVLAVIRGSAVNQDGHSNGLMAPNPAAQMAVLRSAYAAADRAVRDVDFVEAHGTGTLLGDPIEARALGAVLGKGRRADHPLLVGAVKSNIGHLEAAAGIAGFIKTVLALRNGVVPPNPGFSQPNPHINFEQLRLQVVAESTRLDTGERLRLAGVSAFGFGGTNAHVVVEQAPTPVPLTVATNRSDDDMTSPPVPVVISGRSTSRIAANAAALADWWTGAGAGATVGDVAYSLMHHRDRHRYTATVVATDKDQAVAGLRALATDSAAPGVVGAAEKTARPGTVFVYSGQGSQWAGMARDLLRTEPAFAAALAEIEPDFVAQVGFSLQDTILTGEPVVGIDRIQPVLTGLQLALTRLWAAHGVTPDAVVGHSMGEVAAAVVSGALSVADGLKVIATRSRLMKRLSGQGAMALVELDASGVDDLITDFGEITAAVYASPRQTVIAGPPEQIEAAIARVDSRGLLARQVEVDVASHHPIIEPILGELRTALSDLQPRRPTTTLISTVVDSGAPTFDADYWCANLRQPVRFHQAIDAAGADHGVFVEVSPHPLLTYAIDDTLRDVDHRSVATVSREADDPLTFHTNLAVARGERDPFAGVIEGRTIALPTTPWQHASHWFSARERAAVPDAAPLPGTLLGERIDVASPTPVTVWRTTISPDAKPYPGSHRLHGVDVVPISVLVGTLAGAARRCGSTTLTDIVFDHPITVDRTRTVQVIVDGETVSVSSATTGNTREQAAGPPRWVRHAHARMTSVPTAVDDAMPTRPEGVTLIADATSARTADLLGEWGIEGQPLEWAVTALYAGPARRHADVRLPDPSPEALLDAATHIARLVDDSTQELLVPSRIDVVRFPAEVSATDVVVDIRRVQSTDGDLVVDIDGGGAGQTECLRIEGLCYTAVDGPDPTGAITDPRSLISSITWQPFDTDVNDDGTVSPGPARPTVAVVGDEAGAQRLRAGMSAAGATVISDVDTASRVVFVAPDTPAEASHTVAAAEMSAEVIAMLTRLAHRRDEVTLWVVTSGIRRPRTRSALPQSALWGLAGVIAEEQSDHWGGLVDLPAGVDTDTIGSALIRLLARPIRRIASLTVDGHVLVPAIEPVPLPAVAAAPDHSAQALRCRPDSAYLVTGGLGALGLLIADWLVGHGARRIILAGRHGLPPRREWDAAASGSAERTRIDAIRALEQRGVTVDAVSLDVSSNEELTTWMRLRDDAGAPPIKGVVHAAGVAENRLLAETDAQVLQRVMEPKIGGVCALLDVLGDDLDFLHLTGSAGALFGIPGQGGYAAANAYLDALARLRADSATVCIDWVAWQGVGFGARAQIVVDELARQGSRPVTPAEAFAAWDHVVSLGLAQAVVLPRPDGPAADEADGTAPDWSGMEREEMLDALRAGLRGVLAHELRISEDAVGTDIPFAELGLNSLMAMSIRRDAERLAGVELSATMLWNHPTIADLAEHLAEKIAPDLHQATTEDLAEEGGGLLDGLFDSVEDVEEPVLGLEQGI